MPSNLVRRLTQRHSTGGEEREGGFTLIELMIVLLIIAILLAIAIPTFLGARARAQNRAAETNLRNTLTAAKTQYTDADQFSSTAAAEVSALASAEPSITYTTGSVGISSGGSVVNSVSIGVPTSSPVAQQMLVSAAYSQTNTCFYVEDIGQLASAGNPETLYASKAASSTNQCSAGDVTASSTANSTWFTSPSGAGW